MSRPSIRSSKAALEANATALSTTLGGPDRVAGWVKSVYTSGKIPAELKKQVDINAGFMKVEPNQPTKE